MSEIGELSLFSSRSWNTAGWSLLRRSFLEGVWDCLLGPRGDKAINKGIKVSEKHIFWKRKKKQTHNHFNFSGFFFSTHLFIHLKLPWAFPCRLLDRHSPDATNQRVLSGSPLWGCFLASEALLLGQGHWKYDERRLFLLLLLF